MRVQIVRYVTTLGLLFVILVSPAASQPPTLAEQPLVIEGRVLWIDFGTETLMLAPATGGSPIAIDLHRIRQSDYHGFRGNEYSRWWATFSGQAPESRHSSSTW